MSTDAERIAATDAAVLDKIRKSLEAQRRPLCALHSRYLEALKETLQPFNPEGWTIATTGNAIRHGYYSDGFTVSAWDGPRGFAGTIGHHDEPDTILLAGITADPLAATRLARRILTGIRRSID